MQLNCQISNSPVMNRQTETLLFCPIQLFAWSCHHTDVLEALWNIVVRCHVPCACFTILAHRPGSQGPASFWQLLPFVYPSSCSARIIFWRKEDFLPLLDRLNWGEMILELKWFSTLLRSPVVRESPLALLSKEGLPEEILCFFGQREGRGAQLLSVAFWI